MRDLEELVGDGELHVAPGVGHQLGHLCFLGRRPDDLDVELLEEGGRPLESRVGVDPDHLRERAVLLERVALGDPLWTERHLDGDAAVSEARLDILGGARVHGAAQHEERAVPQMRRQLIDDPLEQPHRWVHELIDRRPDDRDDDVGAPDHIDLVTELQPPGLEQLSQQLLGAPLEERHGPALDLGDLLGVDIVDADPATDVREREGERQAHVPAAADDDAIEQAVLAVIHGWHQLPTKHKRRPRLPAGG